MTQSVDLGAVLNVPGATYRQRVNAAVQALASKNYGPGEPSPVYPNMEWYGSASGRIKQRNRDNTAWLDLGPIGEAAAAMGWRVLWPSGSDDTGQINAALAAGHSILLMPGIWLTAGGHSVTRDGQRVVGSKAAPVMILHTSMTANLFNVGDGSRITQRVRFEDFYIWAPVAKTAGYAFNCRNLQQGHWRNVYCGTIEDHQADGHRLLRGWRFDGFFRCSIDRDSSCTVASDGITAFGNDFSGGAELEIEADIVACGGNGALIGGGAGGVYLDGEISVCRTGVRLTSALSGTPNREIFLRDRSIIDSNADYGVLVEHGSGGIVKSQAWIASSGRVNPGEGVGIYVAPDAGPVRFGQVGGDLYNNVTAGANFSAGDIGVTAAEIVSNGDGIIVNDGVIHADIIDNRFRAQAGSDIIIPGVATPSFVVTKNNITRGISNAAPISPTRQIYDNRGFVTAAGGQAIVTAGQLFVDVAHGVAIAPGNHQVRLVPATGWAGVENWWVSHADGTKFRINVGPAPVSNIACYWRVEVGEYS